MFRIKICGLTTIDDAKCVADAGADAVGLNFYEKSKRYVAPAEAEAIGEALPDRVVRVGLFVNASAQAIRQIAARVRLDLVQLHGDEPPELLAELSERPLMRAFRCRETLAPVEGYLAECRRLGCLPRWVLLDAWHADAYGGTGRRGDWTLAARYSRQGNPPLVLAGGLEPDNVAAAIDAVRPAAVDVASGVEGPDGKKGPRRVEAFVRAAREAFSRLEPQIASE